MAVGAPHRDHPGEAGLFAMWVAPDARHAGIGRALVEHVVDWARSRDFPVLRLLVTETNDAAMRLYERCGFIGRGRAAPPPRRIRHHHDVHDDGPVGVSDEADRLVAEQIRYYDDRASEYEDLWFRRGRYDMGPDFNDGWFRETALVEAAVDAFDASGSVLELACGSGIWTRRLAPRARRLVAVDSSSSMIELNRGRFGAANVDVRARRRVRVGAERAVRRGVDRVLHLPHPTGPVRAVLGATRDVAAAGRPALPDRGRGGSGPSLFGRRRGGRTGVRAPSTAGRRPGVHDREAVLHAGGTDRACSTSSAGTRTSARPASTWCTGRPGRGSAATEPERP